MFANTSFDGWSTNVTFNSVNPNIIFFAGGDPSTLTNHYTQWASYKTMKYADYLANPSAVESKTIVYGTENCTCGYIKTNDAPTFQFTSFTEKMSISKICAHCESENVIKTYNPMFTCLGYSAPEFGNGGIAIGFAANQDSIEAYENETGKTVNYGLFAVSKLKAGSNTVFDENGALLDGAIRTDLTGRGYDLIELRITGFTEESHKTAEIAMGGFVAVADENGTTYSYMQAGAPQEGAVYEFVSYNGIIGTEK